MAVRYWTLAFLVVLVGGVGCGDSPSGQPPGQTETQIVMFEVSPDRVEPGGVVTVSWRAVDAGRIDGEPYCTLQWTVRDRDPEPLLQVGCEGSREVVVPEEETGVQFQFSALRSDGATYVTRSRTVTVAVEGSVGDPPPAEPEGSVAGGGGHSLALREDGTVWAWGENAVGQLGDGTSTSRSEPVQVVGLSSVRSVTAGLGEHSLAVREDGSVWAWGGNAWGELGDGSSGVDAHREVPVQVVGLTNVRSVAAGGFHSLAVREDGTVWAWGKNDSGQLGDGSTVDRSSPVQVAGLANVRSVAAGGRHSLALLEDGSVWAWGDNGFGQLGDGGTTSRSSAQQVVGLSGVRTVMAGFFHALAVLEDGSVWAFGANWNGQLGDGGTTARSTPAPVENLVSVRRVDAGDDHSLVVLEDGTVWAFGLNDHGQLGDGSTTDSSVPVQVAGLSDVRAIAAGARHSLAVLEDGSVWAWGANWEGQLGDGSTVDSSVPVKVVASSGMVLEVDTNLISGTTVTLPLRGSLDVSVDWGDGNTSAATSSGDLQHSYASNGSYTISISGDLEQFGAGLDGYPHADAIVGVSAWGDLGFTSLAGAFSGATNLTSVPDDLPGTVTDMSWMFHNASTFDHPIGDWNTQNVANMSGLFTNATAFNQPLDSWNTSNVNGMRNMFGGASTFNQPLNNWNTVNVTDMGGLFSSASAFNQPLDNWNTGNVTDMFGLFHAAIAFNQPIGAWNTSNVTTMHGMFHNAIAFNQPIGAWNTSNVADMNWMFYNTPFNRDLSSWCVVNIPDRPEGFDDGATSWTLPRPVWGTCGDWGENE